MAPVPPKRRLVTFWELGNGKNRESNQPVDSRSLTPCLTQALRAGAGYSGPEEAGWRTRACCLPSANFGQQQPCPAALQGNASFPEQKRLFQPDPDGETGQQIGHRPTDWPVVMKRLARQTVLRPLSRPTTNSTKAITSST
jgi:hypothetical protein